MKRVLFTLLLITLLTGCSGQKENKVERAETDFDNMQKNVKSKVSDIIDAAGIKNVIARDRDDRYTKGGIVLK